MSKDKFVLVNLNEAKDLGQVITNDSCLKILDFLADREASETEIAKALNVPLSTVHYNMTHLVKGGLVVVEEFHYSPKGKEVNHYKLAHKYIIIAPKSVEQTGLKARLRSLLPASLIALAGAGVLSLWKSPLAQKTAALAPPMVLDEVAPQTSRLVAEQAVQEASRVAATEAANGVSTSIVQASVSEAAATSAQVVAQNAMGDTGASAGMQKIAESVAANAPAATSAASTLTQVPQAMMDQAVQEATNAGSTAGLNMIAQQHVAQKVATPVVMDTATSWITHPAIWFLVGAVVVILVVLIIEMMRKKE